MGSKILVVRIPDWLDEMLAQFHPIPKSAIVRDILITFFHVQEIANERGEIPLDAFKESYKKALIETAKEYQKNIVKE